MIYLYSGTPGSGKSYHAVCDVWNKLGRKDRNLVIANFPLALTGDRAQRFTYLDNPEITIDRLMQHARDHHRRGVEGQTLVVIDEAQCIFNSRDWNGKGIVHAALKKNPDTRMDWIKFFSQHRHLGFNFILIAQSDKMIDKQIRVLIEYDVKHLKINNGFFAFLPFTAFLAVERWYGQQMRLGSHCIRYRKKIARLYDSYALFDSLAEDAGQGAPRSGGNPPGVPAPTDQMPQRRQVDMQSFFGNGGDGTSEQLTPLTH